MNKFQTAANAKFPLPDKKDYEGAGEAFIIETGIIKEVQKTWLDGAKYADAIGFAKWLFDNYTKRSKGFVEKDADLETATYYTLEELYEKYLPPTTQ